MFLFRALSNVKSAKRVFHPPKHINFFEKAFCNAMKNNLLAFNTAFLNCAICIKHKFRSFPSFFLLYSPREMLRVRATLKGTIFREFFRGGLFLNTLSSCPPCEMKAKSAFVPFQLSPILFVICYLGISFLSISHFSFRKDD